MNGTTSYLFFGFFAGLRPFTAAVRAALLDFPFDAAAGLFVALGRTFAAALTFFAGFAAPFAAAGLGAGAAVAAEGS
jgi:hypothetical protein